MRLKILNMSRPLIKLDGTMTAGNLAASIGITQRQAQRILSKLKDEGRVIRHGANKNGFLYEDDVKRR